MAPVGRICASYPEALHILQKIQLYFRTGRISGETLKSCFSTLFPVLRAAFMAIVPSCLDMRNIWRLVMSPCLLQRIHNDEEDRPSPIFICLLPDEANTVKWAIDSSHRHPGLVSCLTQGRFCRYASNVCGPSMHGDILSRTQGICELGQRAEV